MEVVMLLLMHKVWCLCDMQITWIAGLKSQPKIHMSQPAPLFELIKESSSNQRAYIFGSIIAPTVVTAFHKVLQFTNYQWNLGQILYLPFYHYLLLLNTLLYSHSLNKILSEFFWNLYTMWNILYTMKNRVIEHWCNFNVHYFN